MNTATTPPRQPSNLQSRPDHIDHIDRYVLHEEVHARPPVALWPNERVLSQAFLVPMAEQQAAQRAWINSISERLGAPPSPVHGQLLRLIELRPEPQRILLKWEMHGEFVVITFYLHEVVNMTECQTTSRRQHFALIHAQLLALGVDPLPSPSGERIAAIDIALVQEQLEADASTKAALFEGNTLLGSTILSTQKAQVWTDLHLDAEGFNRFLVAHSTMGSRQAGRVVQRLLDIDTYRMMALLGLPHAKGMAGPLRSAETELTALARRISEAAGLPLSGLPSGADGLADSAGPLQDDAELLRGVSALASRVEGWISEHGLRFTATEAYSDLVRRALVELNETPIPGIQTLGEFMDRRFEPAMRTCRWTQRRMRELSDRVTRATQSLRTRLEFVNEQQTQALLASMDRRANLQLKLQQTVEGLSLVVLTYYGVGLVAVLAKGAKSLGLDISVDLASAVAVPIIAGTLAWSIRWRVRRAKSGQGGATAEAPNHPKTKP